MPFSCTVPEDAAWLYHWHSSAPCVQAWPSRAPRLISLCETEPPHNALGVQSASSKCRCMRWLRLAEKTNQPGASGKEYPTGVGKAGICMTCEQRPLPIGMQMRRAANRKAIRIITLHSIFLLAAFPRLVSSALSTCIINYSYY